MSFSVTNIMPGKPEFKSQIYSIPDSYSRVYQQEGLEKEIQQKILFYLTQFGGFKTKKDFEKLGGNKFISKWVTYKKKGNNYIFSPSVEFLKIFGHLELKPLEREWRFKKSISESEMEKSGFTQEEIRNSKIFLNRINEYYSGQKLTIPVPSSGISIEDRTKLSRFHSIPYLIKKPKAGGRFFCSGYSYQGISSSLRQLMLINGEESGEVDINAATLQFLTIALSKFTSDKCFLEGLLKFEDPYDYFLQPIRILNEPLDAKEYEQSKKDLPIITRDDIKSLLYTAIYSSKESEKRNINRKTTLLNWFLSEIPAKIFR